MRLALLVIALLVASPALAQDARHPTVVYDPNSEVPSYVTGDARIVWSGLLSAQYDMQVKDAGLPVESPARIANFKHARLMCQAHRGWSNGAGPGAQALLDTCSALALIVQGDRAGCTELRAAAPGLRDPAAESGRLGELVPKYRAAAENILTNGACKQQ